MPKVQRLRRTGPKVGTRKRKQEKSTDWKHRAVANSVGRGIAKLDMEHMGPARVGLEVYPLAIAFGWWRDKPEGVIKIRNGYDG